MDTKEPQRIKEYYFEEYTPREAYEIAAEFNRQANKVRELVQQMSSIHSRIDGSWRGNAASLYMGEYQPQIGEMRSFASQLESMANEIRSIKVGERKYRWVWK